MTFPKGIRNDQSSEPLLVVAYTEARHITSQLQPQHPWGCLYGGPSELLIPAGYYLGQLINRRVPQRDNDNTTRRNAAPAAPLAGAVF